MFGSFTGSLQLSVEDREVDKIPPRNAVQRQLSMVDEQADEEEERETPDSATAAAAAARDPWRDPPEAEVPPRKQAPEPDGLVQAAEDHMKENRDEYMKMAEKQFENLKDIAKTRVRFYIELDVS